jgi:glutathione S-transferase
VYRGEYALVGNELSFFSRKLEAQLRFQRIPWRWHFKTQERTPQLEARAGTHFIPLLMTPEKWLIHDTIALGPLLNDRFHERPVIPSTPLQRSCCFILEDAFNHWLGRVCIHTRWCYPDNIAWVGSRFGANMMLDRSMEEDLSERELRDLEGLGSAMYQNFGKNVCEYNGVGPDEEASMRADFALMLEALKGHFMEHDFLLGPRPCLADFALAGASKAHFITDPTPLSWLGEYREMLSRYTERFFDETPIEGQDWLPDDRVPDTLTGILDYIQRSYLRFATANIAAGLAGRKYYEYDYGFGPTRARSQKRLNVARLHVRNELERIGAPSHGGVQKLFLGRGILEHYLDEIVGE